MNNPVDTTFSAKNLATAVSVYEYTVPAAGTYRFQVRLAAVEGNGDYIAHLTLNDGDAQSDDAIAPRTTYAAASGETAFWFASMSIDALAGDVINVFVKGKANDTNESGSIRIFADNYSTHTVADVWGALVSGLTTLGSIGKLIVDYLDAAISSRLASASYTAPDNASVTAIKAKTDNLPSDPADQSVILAAIGDLTPSITSANTGIDVAIVRYADYSKIFSSLAISASWTKIYLSIKRTKDEADASSQLQLVVSNPAAASTDGVLYVNSAAASAGQRTQGSLAIDQGAGTVTLAINDELTSVLGAPSKGNWYYDIKQVTASSTSILKSGLVAVATAVTKSIS